MACKQHVMAQRHVIMTVRHAIEQQTLPRHNTRCTLYIGYIGCPLPFYQVGYELDWVGVGLGRSWSGYELVWVRVGLGTSWFGYKLVRSG